MLEGRWCVVGAPWAGGTGMVPVPSCRITPNYVRARALAQRMWWGIWKGKVLTCWG